MKHHLLSFVWVKISATLLCLFCLLLIIFNIYASHVIIPWHFNESSYEHHFIAHGGGSINGFIYTDSKESVMHSISNGFKLIELDIIETSDGKLVAAHDWIHFKKITSHSGPHDSSPLSYSEFTKSKIHGNFSPLSTTDINNIFKSHTDLFLVIDKSNNFKKINASLEFSNRIFIEIFGLKNYALAIINNVQRPVFSLSVGKLGPWWEYFKLRIFGMKYVATDKSTYFKHAKLFDKLRENGIKVFIFTINDLSDISSAITTHDATLYTDIEDITALKRFSTSSN